MSHMGIGHQQVAVPDPRCSIVFFGTAIDRHPFAKHVVVADEQASFGFFVALVLWIGADDAVWQKAVVAAGFGVSGQHDMTVESSAFAESDSRSHQAERADGDIGAEQGRGVDMGQW